MRDAQRLQAVPTRCAVRGANIHRVARTDWGGFAQARRQLPVQPLDPGCEIGGDERAQAQRSDLLWGAAQRCASEWAGRRPLALTNQNAQSVGGEWALQAAASQTPAPLRIRVRTASASRAQCNRAVFREAVCSSFMLFIAACSCINAVCTEVINNEYKYSLPKRGSPFNNLSRLCWTASGFGLGRALEAAIDYGVWRLLLTR